MPWHTCVNSRDSITQDSGFTVADLQNADSGHVIKSHCRDANGTWVVWTNPIAGGQTGSPNTQDHRMLVKATWPSDIASAYALSVGYFPDDGSGPIVYDLQVDAYFGWGHLPSGRDSNGCGYYFIIGATFENDAKTYLTSWNMNVLDVQVRTDGTNVWVIALAQETVLYPYLFNNAFKVDRCAVPHPIIPVSPFSRDWDNVGYYWIYAPPASGIGGPLFTGSYDDPGPDLSTNWNPARITVWGGDIGGFSKIDTIEAVYNNASGYGLTSGIEAAASPAEPGVLHVLWGEGGFWAYTEPHGISHFNAVGQRTVYSKWSSSSKIFQEDLFRYEYAFGGDLDALNYDASGFNTAGTWAWTGEMILRNDHGSPIAIFWPWVQEENVSGIGPTGGIPQYLDRPFFYDLNTGNYTFMDASLIPTAEECGYGTSSGLTMVGAGTVLSSSWLIGFGQSVQTPRRSQFASSLYSDPTLGNQQVYLICAAYDSVDLSVGASGGPTVQAQGRPTAFYRVTADGTDLGGLPSAGVFGWMDGIRQSNYSITPQDDFAGGTSSKAGFISDFVSDPGNVWVPSADIPGGGVLHLPRTCERTWEYLPSFPIPDPLSGYETAAFLTLPSNSPPGLVYNANGDWIVAGGYGSSSFATPPYATDVTAAWAKICRCCVPCHINTGLHVWQVL